MKLRLKNIALLYDWSRFLGHIIIAQVIIRELTLLIQFFVSKRQSLLPQISVMQEFFKIDLTGLVS